jgi:hypothetical protein
MKIVIRSKDLKLRNPVAAELHTAALRKRVIKDRTVYSRKQKHRKAQHNH